MRASVPAPSPEPEGQPLQAAIPRAIRELEKASHELFRSSWGEHERERAYDMALALTEACKLAGIRYAADVARAAASLFRVRRDEALEIEDALREKVLEILEILKDMGNAQAESA